MKALLLLTLLFPLVAGAGTLTVTWVNPVTYSDNSALAATDITQTRVEYGTCNGTAFGTRINQGAVQGTLTTIVFSNLPPATYCVRAYTTAKGVESIASAVSISTITQPPPNPPTLVTGSTSAYEARPASTTAPLALVGLTQLGAPCGPETKVINGTTYCRVAKSSVDAVVWPQNLALNDLWVKAAPP